jgi:DNA-binding MarR family transcriptional regulator
MPTKNFLSVVRELVRCYQAFETFSARHIRTLDLTPPQFDIIATLGNTEGMSCKDLGEKTLITKGTLTGVVDRLSDKNLVRRLASSSDGRSQIVQLTAKGKKLFAEIFPAHLEHMQRPFAGLSQTDLQQSEIILKRLRSTFENHLEKA